MNNTISVNPKTYTKTQMDIQMHYKLVNWSGYAALGFGTVCGATGLKKVKFPFKHNVHKFSAYLAGITSFLHLGIVKGLDRIFDKKNV